MTVGSNKESGVSYQEDICQNQQDRAVKLEEIKKRIYKKITVVCTEAFILVALLILLNHAVDVSYLIFDTPQVPINWLEIGIDLFFVLMIGAFAIYWVSRLDVERKQAEDKIKHAAEEWRTTFDSITDLISIQDRSFRLTRVNRAFADAFKMEPKEFIGKHCYQVVHGIKEPFANCPHKQTLETKQPARAEFFEPNLGLYLEGSTSPIFNEKGEVTGSVHILNDITERKKMEQQLIITDRLASIGELAAGVAHELNNPLTSVIGFSQLLLEKNAFDADKEDLRIIYTEAQRAAEVVKNLLAFARKHEPAKQLVNINRVIEKVLELRAYEERVSNIQVITHFAPDLPENMADYFQLQQVFLNIIINAEHFMIEARSRGVLTITTEWTGDAVKASFADDGPGIAEENLGHISTPSSPLRRWVRAPGWA